jgi:hypothetical protein
MGIVIIVVIVIAFIGLIAYGIISKRKREQAMAGLATQQGWTALSNDAVTLNQYLPQYVQMLGQQNYGFGVGFHRSSNSYDMAYQAKIGDHSAVLFQYQYTEYHYVNDGQGGNNEQSQTYYFTIVNVTMPVAEPTILLLHHSFMSKLSNFGLHSGMQQISLEGDFNQSYDTYIAPDSQVAVLSLLTPDVMEQVAALAGTKKGVHASMQMGGQNMIVSFENQVLTPEFIQTLLAQVTTLLAKLDAKPQVVLQVAQAPVPAEPTQPPTPPVV